MKTAEFAAASCRDSMTKAQPSPNRLHSFHKLRTTELYDVFGKICLREELSSESTSTEIDISSLKSGIYYCRLSSNKNITTVKKLVITK